MLSPEAFALIARGNAWHGPEEFGPMAVRRPYFWRVLRRIFRGR